MDIDIPGPYEVLNSHHRINYTIKNSNLENFIPEMQIIPNIFENIKIESGTFKILTTLNCDILEYKEDEESDDDEEDFDVSDYRCEDD